MDVTLASEVLISAPVLAFILGAIAVAIRSDLRLPDQLMTSLSMYLLLAIGLEGGVALRQGDPADMVVPLTAGLALGVLIPLCVFAILRFLTPYEVIDRAAIAAHYGSTSLVTFTAAITVLASIEVVVPPYAYALLTALEIPGIVVGLMLARSRSRTWGATARELVSGTSIVLLVGGLALGLTVGPDGYASISPVFSDAFSGLLVIFLLGLGIKAAQGARDLRHGGLGLVSFAALFPVLVMASVTTLGTALGLGVGGAVILAVVSASASYIAAPAAVRVALPEANLALPLTASLTVTFPVNLVVGIPLAIGIASALA